MAQERGAELAVTGSASPFYDYLCCIVHLFSKTSQSVLSTAVEPTENAAAGSTFVVAQLPTSCAASSGGAGLA